MKVKIEFTIDVTKEQRAALAHAMTSQTNRLATRGDVRFLVAGLGMGALEKLLREDYGVSTRSLTIEPCNTYKGSCLDAPKEEIRG